MRLLVDKTRLQMAIGLALIAALSFSIAWAMRSAANGSDCVRAGRPDAAIRRCVAQEARETEPAGPMLIALGIGGLALCSSVVTGARGIKRVMSLAQAGEELSLPPGKVRKLVDEGVLSVSSKEPSGVYLNPHEVRRVSYEALRAEGNST